jgi:hypothetical protein
MTLSVRTFVVGLAVLGSQQSIARAQVGDFFNDVGGIVTNQQPVVSGGGFGGGMYPAPPPVSVGPPVSVPPAVSYNAGGSYSGTSHAPVVLIHPRDQVRLMPTAPPNTSTPHHPWVNPNPYNSQNTFGPPHNTQPMPPIVHNAPAYVPHYQSPPPPPVVHTRRHR